MAIETQQPLNGLYPIIITSTPFTSNTLPVGTLCVQQNGVFGTPLGLLLALTMTPQFFLSIQTTNGLRKVC